MRIALFCAALVSLAAPASAQPFSWVRGRGAESCIDQESLERLIAARLGDDPFELEMEERILARIDPREGTGFRISISLVDANGIEIGARTLEPPGGDCRALDMAAVLLVATAIADARALASPAPIETALETQIETTAIEAPAIEAPAIEAPPIEAPPIEGMAVPWRMALDLAGAMAIGLLPEPAGAVEVGIELTPPGFVPLTIDLAWWNQPETRAAGAHLAFTLVDVGIGACPRAFRSEVFELALCAQLALAWLHAEGRGFAVDLSSDRALPGARGLVRTVLRMAGAFWIGLDAGVQVPFVHDSFYVEPVPGERQIVHRIEPLSFVARVRLIGDFAL